ncbi:hypothetical protein ACLOJK_013533 [Asimina triloba]
MTSCSKPRWRSSVSPPTASKGDSDPSPHQIRQPPRAGNRRDPSSSNDGVIPVGRRRDPDQQPPSSRLATISKNPYLHQTAQIQSQAASISPISSQLPTNLI